MHEIGLHLLKVDYIEYNIVFGRGKGSLHDSIVSN